MSRGNRTEKYMSMTNRIYHSYSPPPIPVLCLASTESFICPQQAGEIGGKQMLLGNFPFQTHTSRAPFVQGGMQGVFRKMIIRPRGRSLKVVSALLALAGHIQASIDNKSIQKEVRTPQL
jgi:hypothetical protein